ncbi:hypothetical protein [Microbacterium oxydans]|uniref:hypothetical protein n=1 Tax=Microbacterium oxydans TaxID=82380 RepID=UPI00366BEE37
MHMGVMFGLANQIVLLIAAVGIAAMVVLGYLILGKRRPAHDMSRLMGSPPRRSLPRAPWWGIGAVGAVAVVLGLWLPLVGWTLLGFVILDVLIGVATARRAKAG